MSFEDSLTIVDFLRILERVLRYFGDRYRLYQGHKSVKVHEMDFLMSYGEGISFSWGQFEKLHTTCKCHGDTCMAGYPLAQHLRGPL